MQLCSLVRVLVVSSSWLLLLAVLCIRTSLFCGLEGDSLQGVSLQFDFAMSSRDIQNRDSHIDAQLSSRGFDSGIELVLPGMLGRSGGVEGMTVRPGIAAHVCSMNFRVRGTSICARMESVTPVSTAHGRGIFPSTTGKAIKCTARLLRAEAHQGKSVSARAGANNRTRTAAENT